MLTVVLLRDETAALQTQLLHSMLAMTLAGHCPIPETIQTTMKSQPVCLYCYMCRILCIWLLVINKYTEDFFHIMISSRLTTSCFLKLYAIEEVHCTAVNIRSLLTVFGEFVGNVFLWPVVNCYV